MTDETSTLEQGGGEALPQVTPKNDAQAAELEAQKSTPEGVQGAPDPKEEAKKRNRTREFIERRNEEVRQLRAEVEQLKSRVPKEPERKAPNPDDFYNDPQAYLEAQTEWKIEQRIAQRQEEENKRAEAQRQSEVVAAYQQRAAEFAADHEDFEEVVSSIPAELLPKELQAAIMAHPKGAEIAYQLALNEDELFSLAGMRPEVMTRAVERYASRMSDAPNGEPAQPAIPALAQAQTKPITQAPAPAPRVGGRAPAEVPPEKLTDDEWYRRDREARRKR